MLIRLAIDRHLYASETHFMQSFKAGESQAFDCIYRQMYQPLTLSARAMINSYIDAENIAAGAFLKLYTHGRKNVASLEHIKRWMFIVVRNDSIIYLQHRSKERAAKRELLYNHQIWDNAHPEKPDTALQQKAMTELEKLPKQAKKVLQLYYLSKQNTGQIAAQLQIKGQTVLNHKMKGLQSLRRRVIPKSHSK